MHSARLLTVFHGKHTAKTRQQHKPVGCYSIIRTQQYPHELNLETTLLSPRTQELRNKSQEAQAASEARLEQCTSEAAENIAAVQRERDMAREELDATRSVVDAADGRVVALSEDVESMRGARDKLECKRVELQLELAAEKLARTVLGRTTVGGSGRRGRGGKAARGRMEMCFLKWAMACVEARRSQLQVEADSEKSKAESYEVRVCICMCDCALAAERLLSDWSLDQVFYRILRENVFTPTGGKCCVVSRGGWGNGIYACCIHHVFCLLKGLTRFQRSMLCFHHRVQYTWITVTSYRRCPKVAESTPTRRSGRAGGRGNGGLIGDTCPNFSLPFLFFRKNRTSVYSDLPRVRPSPGAEFELRHCVPGRQSWREVGWREPSESLVYLGKCVR